MREQFEKLPEIAEKVKYLLFIDGEYECIKWDYVDLENYVNGAYYAFQEQQKKINKVLHYLDCASNPLDIEVDDIRSILK